jgi:hypothetical protein
MFGALFVSMGLVAATGHMIGEKMARTLMSEAMAAIGIGTKSFVLVPYVDSPAPDFYSFQALRQNSTADGNIGFFAVNRWTGDVWSVDACKRITSLQLTKELESILKRSGMSAPEAATLRGRSPACRP